MHAIPGGNSVATTIMGSLLSFARTTESVPPICMQNAAALQPLLIDPMVVDTPPEEEERVSLDNIACTSGPLLVFSQRDGSWRLSRQRVSGTGAAPLKPTGKFALSCPVCHGDAMSQQTRIAHHAVLEKCFGIRLPCCAACAPKIDACTDVGIECMCCLDKPSESAVWERPDNGAKVQLCTVCCNADWMTVLKKAVGLDTSAKRAHDDDDGGDDALVPTPTKKDAARKKKKSIGCIACGEEEQVVRCGASECTRGLCDACLRASHGSMAVVYRNTPGVWRCETHCRVGETD